MTEILDEALQRLHDETLIVDDQDSHGLLPIYSAVKIASPRYSVDARERYHRSGLRERAIDEEDRARLVARPTAVLRTV